MVVDLIEGVFPSDHLTKLFILGFWGVSKNRAHTMILSGLEKPPAVPVVSLWAI